MPRLLLSLAVLFPLCPLSASGQNTSGQEAPRQINVNYISGDITVDGTMDEAARDRADTASNFWQFFPTDTGRAEHPTEMRMLYNESTRHDDHYVVEMATLLCV